MVPVSVSSEKVRTGNNNLSTNVKEVLFKLVRGTFKLIIMQQIVNKITNYLDSVIVIHFNSKMAYLVLDYNFCLS